MIEFVILVDLKFQGKKPFKIGTLNQNSSKTPNLEILIAHEHRNNKPDER